MNCPKCSAEMETVAFKDVEVERCTSCGGLWFDMLEHEDLSKLKGAAEAIDTGDAAKGREMDELRVATCPKCHARMLSVHVPDQPHIVYEQCQICNGIFMDAGEFKDFSKVTLGEFIRGFFT